MESGPELSFSAARRLASKAPSVSSSSEASTALESPGEKLRTTPTASLDCFRPSASDAGSLSDAASSSASGERRGSGAAELPLRLPLSCSRRQAWCDVEDDFEHPSVARPTPDDQQCSPPSRRNLLRYDRRRRQREEKRQSPSLLTQADSRRSPKARTKQQQEQGALPLTPSPPPPPDYSPKLAVVEGFLPTASTAGTTERTVPPSGIRQPIIMSTSPMAARSSQHLPQASLGFFPPAPPAANHLQGSAAGWSLSAALGITDTRPPPPPPPPFAPTATTPSNSSSACGALSFLCGPPSSAPQAHLGVADASSRPAAFPLGWPSSGSTPGVVPAAAAGSSRCTLEALLTPVGSSDRAQLAARLLAAAPESYED